MLLFNGLCMEFSLYTGVYSTYPQKPGDNPANRQDFMNDLSVASASTDQFEQRWPVDNAKAAVVIVHGLGEHCGRYGALVSALNNAGYSAASLDLPGHGKSAGARGHIDDFVDFHAPILALSLDLRRQHPAKPLYILGHSMGGLIVTHMMLDHEQLFDGIVLSGALIRSVQQPPIWQITLTGLIAKVAPRLGLLRIEIDGLCRDSDVVEAYLQDPLVSRDKLTANFISEMFNAMEETVSNASTITKPILMMHGGADRMTDPSGSQLIFDSVISPDKTLKIYPGLYHEIFNEPEAPQVFGDVIEWLDKRVAIGSL